jgi:hypothetical protein
MIASTFSSAAKSPLGHAWPGSSVQHLDLYRPQLLAHEDTVYMSYPTMNPTCTRWQPRRGQRWLWRGVRGAIGATCHCKCSRQKSVYKGVGISGCRVESRGLQAGTSLLQHLLFFLSQPHHVSPPSRLRSLLRAPSSRIRLSQGREEALSFPIPFICRYHESLVGQQLSKRPALSGSPRSTSTTRSGRPNPTQPYLL